jgi:uncharacterized membrane protein YeaQ/YmgE (transglycosylase-associated protein family)
MRVEPAIIFAAVGSVLPGWLISFLGDGRTEYGFLLLLIALPFYCFGIVCLVVLIHVARRYFRLTSMRSYVVFAVVAGSLASLVVAPNGGRWAALAFGVSVTIAVLLVPFIQRQRDRADV